MKSIKEKFPLAGFLIFGNYLDISQTSNKIRLLQCPKRLFGTVYKITYQRVTVI